MVKYWTEQEIIFLQDNYKNLTVKEMTKILKRSKSAIHYKLKNLDLIPNKSERFWTEEEDRILIENSLMSMKELQSMFFQNKSIPSINHRIQRLGLQKSSIEYYSEELKEKYINLASQYSIYELCDILELEYNQINYLKQRTGIEFKSDKHRSAIEKHLENFLINNNINYKSQYITNNCRHIYPLRFDFAIYDNKCNLIYLLETQGQQHYKPVSIFGGKLEFEKQQIRDSIKSKFCEQNNIKLIEIPYWEFNNIEQILNNLLSKTVA